MLLVPKNDSDHRSRLKYFIEETATVDVSAKQGLIYKNIISQERSSRRCS